MKNKNYRIAAAAILAILILVGAAWSIDLVYNESRTAQVSWKVVETVTSAGTEPTDLAVTERTYTTILAAIAAAADGDDEIEIFSVPDGWNIMRFRCIGITENGTVTHQIYLGTLASRGTNCEMVKAGQLAWVIGTQASTTSTYEMADAVTVTPYCWPKPWVSSNPGSNLVAEAAIDLMGADIVIVVTTAASCNAKLLGKGY